MDRTYFSTWGPLDGPIPWRDESPALGAYDSPAGGMPVGIAYPRRTVRGPKAPVQTYALILGKESLEGFFVCDGRRFVQLGEAAE